MDPKKLKHFKHGPEYHIREAIIKMLTLKGWHTMITHGNMFQSGFPDIYATHADYKQRWIECKNPKAFHFTSEQRKSFPLLTANGTGIWILALHDPNNDEELLSEYKKLFSPANWWTYMLAMEPIRS